MLSNHTERNLPSNIPRGGHQYISSHVYAHIFSRLHQNCSISDGQPSRSFACWCNPSMCGQRMEWKLLIFHYRDASWAPWRLKSPATPPFAQPFVHTYIKENIKASRYWPFETRIYLRASNAEMCPCYDVSSELVSKSVMLNELILLFTV